MRPRNALPNVADAGLALAAVALIIALGSNAVIGLGITSTALLLTLPVLWAASRSNAAFGSAIALIASAAFNYFLLPPRLTFRIDGPTYVVAFVVFVVVALVTGGFAAGLRARQDDADHRAQASEFEADFLAEIALATSRNDLDRRALEFLSHRYGDARLFGRAELQAKTTGLAPLDAAAAIWALEHDAVTGKASEVMPSADFRFLSFGRGSADVVGLPTTRMHPMEDATFLQRLAAHWGHARDHLDTLAERTRREEIEQRDRTRRALLGALGHDFRTPLTVLKEGLTRLPGASEAGLLAEVERLRMLGEDLLASARLDAGLPLSLEPIDLVDTVIAMERQVARQAEDIELVVIMPAELPLVRAEPVMLNHLLGNLLENALRHAKKRVEISGRVAGGSICLQIADDGPGVSAEISAAIFEPFVSGDRAEHRNARGGSGLGLAIARDLARAMDATLVLEPPTEGKGAVFCLALPIASARSEPG